MYSIYRVRRGYIDQSESTNYQSVQKTKLVRLLSSLSPLPSLHFLTHLPSCIGSVMALHLFLLPSLSTPTPQLHLLIGFESGLLTLLKFTPTPSFHLPSSSSSIYFPIEGKIVSESEGWELVWMEKSHRDASESLLF